MNEIISVLDTNISQFFLGFAFLLIAIAIFYWFMQFGRYYKISADKEETYNLVEMGQLYILAEEKGIDIDFLREKMSMIKKNKFNFRQKLEESVYEQMFGSTESKKEGK